MHDHSAGVAASWAGSWAGLLDAFGLPAALFLGGLVGSLSHCALMCGPFVLAQVTARLESGVMGSGMGAGGELVRLAGAALVPYHLGRITTYTALGGVAGAITGQVTALAGFSWLLAACLALAALSFAAQAVEGLRRGAGGGGALAAAAGAGSAARGALAMAAFTLGTVPALIGVGWLGAFFGRRWLPTLRLLIAPVMLFNAAVLLILAWRAVS